MLLEGHKTISSATHSVQNNLSKSLIKFIEIKSMVISLQQNHRVQHINFENIKYIMLIILKNTIISASFSVFLWPLLFYHNPKFPGFIFSFQQCCKLNNLLKRCQRKYGYTIMEKLCFFQVFFSFLKMHNKEIKT